MPQSETALGAAFNRAGYENREAQLWNLALHMLEIGDAIECHRIIDRAERDKRGDDLLGQFVSENHSRIAQRDEESQRRLDDQRRCAPSSLSQHDGEQGQASPDNQELTARPVVPIPAAPSNLVSVVSHIRSMPARERTASERMAALKSRAESGMVGWLRRGAGDHGFAQIIGEAGDLSIYANPGKLWKRLGLAPYQGLAMSSWMRKTWRPRTLEKQEWIDNPFKPERYAIVAQIATHLCDHQVESKAKSGTKHGRPKGPYGEHYVRRREHTDITHPDWSDGHARSDALRYTVKKFVRDLWTEWRRATRDLEPRSLVPAADIFSQEERQANA